LTIKSTKNTCFPFVFCFFFIFLHGVYLPAQDELPARVRPATFPFGRDAGFGGAHVGIADSFSTLLTNPAGLAAIEKQTNIAEIVVSLIDVDLMVKLLFTDDPLPEFANLLVKRFEANLDIGGPFAFGRVGKRWGFGVFNVSRLGFIWDRNEIYSIDLSLTEELILAGGYGFRLLDGSNATLDLGLTAKGFLRVGYDSPPFFIQEVRYILEHFAEWPFQTQLGGGVDLGLRWTVADTFSFGAVYYDPFSPVWVVQYSQAEKMREQEITASGIVPITSRAALGVAYRMRSPFWHRYISDLYLCADFQGLLASFGDRQRSPLLDIGLGMEIRFHEVLSFRFGFMDMLPGGAVSLDFTFMIVYLAFYGKELGTEPAEYVTYAANINLQFRF
jgi:hypothetical protein